MALYLQLLRAFVQYGNGSINPEYLAVEQRVAFGSGACCVFVNHLALGGNGCLLHGPAASWQAPRTAETMGMSYRIETQGTSIIAL